MIQRGFESNRDNKKLTLNCDLAVIGGGIAGVCCAITAARAGIRVVLVQDRPVLGGNSSSEVRLWILGATSHMGNNNRWSREGGVMDEILLENLYRNKEGNPLILDSILLEKVNSEPNIQLLLNTSVYEVNKKSDTLIESVLGFCSQNGTTYEVKAPLFTDASGDGLVAFQAGASFRMGAEPPEEFGEPCAPDIDDYGELLGHSMYFYSKDVGRPIKYVAPSFALKDANQLVKMRSFDLQDHGCKLWWVEFGGRMDTVHDTEEIKWELWKVIYGIWDHVKNSGDYPGAENLTLEWVGTIPGKRESRRFEGDYMLKQQDIVFQKQHYDAVAHGGWAIDLHPADGVYSTKHSSCTQWHSKGTYQIPYRCYYSKDLDNLFLAGRIISASHVAFGSTRVMATSGNGAQAVGMAAAMALKNNLYPRNIAQSPYIEELQSELNKRGQSIPQVPLYLKDNLLDSASVHASSELLVSKLPDNGPWMSLEYATGQMLPLQKGLAYTFKVKLKSKGASMLQVELRTTSKDKHFTPDVTVESMEVELQDGEQWVTLEFSKPMPIQGYGFLCFLKNDAVQIKGSDQRFSGILSVFNKPHKEVSNMGKQCPPKDSGLESFEFWCPERRPNGTNIALEIQPPLTAFKAENIKNGLIRPTANGSTNLWCSALEDKTPTLDLKWPTPQRIKELHLFFDTDFDHPLETVLMGHPEAVIPFCVGDYALYDAKGNLLAEQKDNHQTQNVFYFTDELETDQLTLKFEKPSKDFPAAVFQVICL